MINFHHPGSNLNTVNRGTETEEQILKRLRNARAEIEQGQSSNIFDHMLYNDNLEECYESLKVTVRMLYARLHFPLCPVNDFTSLCFHMLIDNSHLL